MPKVTLTDLFRALEVGGTTFALYTAVLIGAKPQPEVRWVEDTFEDFKDGQFDASGQNLYVSRKGEIKTVHRFDLNADGYLDLVFNTSHDFVTGPPPTLYELPGGRSAGKAFQLPVNGASYAAVADLNKDGLPDLVLCPNDNWVTPRRYLFILWGGADGWSARRMTNLLTIGPRAVQVADLDGDGWPEIAVLNGSRWAPEDGSGTILRIYWGSRDGFRQEWFDDLFLGDASDLKVWDLDGDQRPELVVAQSNPGEALVYWNDRIKPKAELPKPSRVDLRTPNVSRLGIIDYNRDGKLDLILTGGIRELIGRDPTTGEEMFRYSGIVCLPAKGPRGWGEPRVLEAPPSSTMAVGNLDRDGWADIVLADGGSAKDSVRILWGDSEGQFRARPPLSLPVAYGSALALGELDGDDNLDLVVGVAQGRDTYDASSRIFYGDGQGKFELAALEIPTMAVTDVLIAPGEGRNSHRLIFCNRIAGRINEDVPVRVFWGGKDGFHPQRFSPYQIRSGYASVAADLNDDGYPDLVLGSIVHNVREPHREIGFNILWGGKDGLKDDRRTIVREAGLLVLAVADLDRDGYLDLIAACNTSTSDNPEPPRVAIWYGSANGFDRRRRLILPAAGTMGCTAIADFNKDGYLDVAVSRSYAHLVSIFWGSKDGFSVERQASLPLLSADDINTADLDGDGWLDLVVTSWRVPGTLEWDYGTYIFWGGPQGFSQARAQRLPGHSACGINVADYDHDGHLDLLVPNYRYPNTRQSIPAFLFWGSTDGFAELNRTDLPVDSGHAALSADFNGDGLIDVAISCHSRDNTHWTNSRVFYNDGQRFTHSQFVSLPTIGTHYMYRADVGNIYDRSYRETYISKVFRWDEARRNGMLTPKAETPGHSRLEFAVRSAATEAELLKQPWSVLRQKEGATPALTFTVTPNARYLQYRAVFISDNGDRYPILDRVEIALTE